jgi:Mn2+/Fe2+ NRAMP family transporter
VKKLLNLALGVVTSIGGFVEAGSISTAAQAGAEYGFALLWAIAVAGLLLAMLAEMSGRLATMSRRSITAAIRERFGLHYHLVPLVAELGGAAIAVTLLTGVGFQWWILPIAASVWLMLWFGRLVAIEDGLGLLGMVTLTFVVSAWQLHPDPRALFGGFLPSRPSHDVARYAFLAVSIVGATISPYLLNFYGSSGIEEKWHESDLWINRATSFLGMGFGSVVSMGVLVTSALTLRGVKVESYDQAAMMFTPVFGQWGVTLFALSLGIGCFGAAVELSLKTGYDVAQSFGWAWGIERKRADTARFSMAFIIVLTLATLIGVLGLDPLRVTLTSVALTVIILPLIVLPFLVLMNEEDFVGPHRSGPIGNVVLALLTVAGGLMALVVVPLELLGG